MRILTFLAGAAAGYILGARAGRESYDKLMDQAGRLWRDPRTQEKLNDLGETIKEKAPDVGAAVGSAASSVAGKVRETASHVAHKDNDDAATAGSRKDAPAHAADHVSDPALGSAAEAVGGEKNATEWAAEGGATPSGPATGN